MNDADKTPIDGRGPIEMILDAVNVTRDTQLRMYEELKLYRVEAQRAEVLARKAVRYPVAVCIVSALLCLGSVFARFAP